MSATWLINRMRGWENEKAMIWHDCQLTYKNILEAVESWMRELNLKKIQEGSVVAIEGDYSPKTCALLLALILKKAIIVPLTKMVGKRRKDFIDIAEVQYIFTFDGQDNWQIEKCKNSVNHFLTRQLLAMHEPGLVLFSSGSTGKNKAALHNFSKFLQKFTIPRSKMCTLIFLLFDHIGGINTLFYTLSNGGTIVISSSRTPVDVCRLIEKYKVELLPTSPSFLNLLLVSEAYLDHDLSSLKRITYGTEVMPESLLKRLRKIFPWVEFVQTYGLTELGILRSKSKTYDSLWVKVGGEGFKIKVIDGVLWIKADSAMLGYLNAPSPFDEDGWMNTEDLVEVEGDYIRILGRKSDVINVGGQKVYPAEVESVLMEMDNVVNASVRGEKNLITGNIIVARLTLAKPEEMAALKKRVRKFCQERLESYKMPVKIEVVEDIQCSDRFKKMKA